MSLNANRRKCIHIHFTDNSWKPKYLRNLHWGKLYYMKSSCLAASKNLINLSRKILVFKGNFKGIQNPLCFLVFVLQITKPFFVSDCEKPEKNRMFLLHLWWEVLCYFFLFHLMWEAHRILGADSQLQNACWGVCRMSLSPSYGT